MARSATFWGGFAVSQLLVVSQLMGWGGAKAAPVSFETADHVRVFADYVPAADSHKPVILLFHQAGASGAEYQSIAPHLQHLGYSTLQVDQRAGGTLFGRANATVSHLGHSTGYLDALPDLEAAVTYARAQGHTGAVVAWGSSYSASLVFLLAAKNPQVSAIIALSPGEYFADPRLVHDAAARVHQPVLVSSAASGEEQAAAASLLASTLSTWPIQLKPKSAGHGSSALDGPAGAEIWPPLEHFLARVAMP